MSSSAVPTQEPITIDSPEALDDPNATREETSADATKVNFLFFQTHSELAPTDPLFC